MEVSDSVEHTSLLRYRINYGYKMFDKLGLDVLAVSLLHVHLEPPEANFIKLFTSVICQYP